MRILHRTHRRPSWCATGALLFLLASLGCSNEATTEVGDDEPATTDDASAPGVTDEPSGSDDDTDGGGAADDASDDVATDDVSTDEASIDDFVQDDEPTDPADAGGEMCGATPFGASEVPANVLVIVDKSGSMTEVPEGFDGDKWSALGQALGEALQGVEEDVSFGLHVFPYPDGCAMPEDGALSVEVGPGVETVPQINELLAELEPSGGTPTASALAQAFAYFTEGDGQNLTGRKYVLLATDGGPICNEALSCGSDQCVVNLEGRCHESFENCCDPDEVGDETAGRNCLDDDETLVQVEALHAAGIETFVVGIPGSGTFADSTDAFAVAGGRPAQGSERSYYAVNDVDALRDVLQSITRELLTSCELQLDSTPPDPNKLNVEVEGEIIPQDGPDGWELHTDSSPPTVVLQGATCERIEADGVESIRVVYGCPTFQVR